MQRIDATRLNSDLPIAVEKSLLFIYPTSFRSRKQNSIFELASPLQTFRCTNMTTPTPKIEIASQLLDTALCHFFSEPPEYFATICLASAAEELLGRHVEAKGGESSLNSIKNGAVRLSRFLDEEGEPTTVKAIHDLMNNAKNSTKHMNGGDDSTVDFDPRVEAKNLLDRGVTNYYQLMGHYELKETDLLTRFNNERGA